MNVVEKRKRQLHSCQLCFTLLDRKGRESGVIWRVAMYTGEYNLHVTRAVDESFQKLASNPANRDGNILDQKKLVRLLIGEDPVE